MVGPYRVEGVLGRGGMATVYAAVQERIEARVAIKVLNAPLCRQPKLVQRFVDEARVVNRIGHPNIIDVFSFGELEDGRQYFVMELIEGQSLQARLEQGLLGAEEAKPLLRQICDALEAAHQEGVVHRDLKPDNIWIAQPKHAPAFAKVLDFGIAKLLAEPDPVMVTEEGVALGTPHFMSPEQCRGQKVDQRTDIYAMGVILYLSFTGRYPFEASTFLGVITQHITATPTPPSSHQTMSAALERLILSCLAKDPAQRPPSARSLGLELENALAVSSPAPTLLGHAAPVNATNPTMACQAEPAGSGHALSNGRLRSWVAVAGLTLVVAAFGLCVQRSDTPRELPKPLALPAVMPMAATPAAVAPTLLPADAATQQEAAAREEPSRPRAPRASASGGALKRQPASASPSIEDPGFLKENPFR